MRSTIGPIERFMVEDHAKVDELLGSSEGVDGRVHAVRYSEFRERLLRHIAMEEKVLLPFARARRDGVALDVAAQLRRDHGAIAKLLVRSPTTQGIEALRRILGEHNAIEEGPDGLYATCDALAGDDGVLVVERLEAQPRVPLAPYYDGVEHGLGTERHPT